MAWSLNRAEIIGNVGKDVDLRRTTGGKAVLKFSVATNEEWIAKDGEKKKHTEWHNIVVFGGSAEWLSNQIRTGDKIGVTGKIRSRTWDKQDGSKGYATDIQVNNLDNIILLEKMRAVERQEGSWEDLEEINSDDIPF